MLSSSSPCYFLYPNLVSVKESSFQPPRRCYCCFPVYLLLFKFSVYDYSRQFACQSFIFKGLFDQALKTAFSITESFVSNPFRWQLFFKSLLVLKSPTPTLFSQLSTTILKLLMVCTKIPTHFTQLSITVLMYHYHSFDDLYRNSHPFSVQLSNFSVYCPIFAPPFSSTVVKKTLGSLDRLEKFSNTSSY